MVKKISCNQAKIYEIQILHGHPLAGDANGSREALDLADVGVGDVVATFLLHLSAGRL